MVIKIIVQGGEGIKTYKKEGNKSRDPGIPSDARIAAGAA